MIGCAWLIFWFIDSLLMISCLMETLLDWSARQWSSWGARSTRRRVAWTVISGHAGDRMTRTLNANTYVCLSVDWLIDCVSDLSELVSYWFIDWLSERVSYCVSDWASERLIYWLIEWVSEWLNDWLIEWASERLIEWVSELLIDWFLRLLPFIYFAFHIKNNKFHDISHLFVAHDFAVNCNSHLISIIFYL